ncbi:NAD(P)/FAD-dependent oxidoreductase [Sulfurimonas sp. NW15]|uniref:dihydrolipoyl dehydrogenase family protein n=1 Tax=Sulfurimonas sp. NW15 TaxID=2922729 RepID=UPI003DA9FBCF
MKTEYDLIIIGAGPAGTPTAMAAAQFGIKVLLIDKREAPGGECLFEGCIPSKVLENAANKYWDVLTCSTFNVELKGSEQIHWEAVLEDKDMILKKRSMAALKQIARLPSLDFKQGKAAFVDGHTVEVGGELFGFKKALIATGAKSSIPDIKGNGVDKVWTNRDLFFEEEIPKELLFIGAGAISCELVQMFAKLGTKCHVLERGEKILQHISKDATDIVYNNMLTLGIKVDLNIVLEKIDYENDKFIIHFKQEGKKQILEYDNVVMATGRVANLDNLALEKAKVAYDEKGILVNEKLQSSQEHIYACGDCINSPKFAHTASYEAGVVVHNMYAPSPHVVDYDKNSWVLFSDPQIAVVGIDENVAKKREIEISTEVYNYEIDARAQIDKRTDGFVKFIIDKKTKIIIGVEIVSADASSLAGEASLIVANKMTAMDVLGAIHPHPTLGEAFGKLAQQIFFKSMMQKSRR